MTGLMVVVLAGLAVWAVRKYVWPHTARGRFHADLGRGGFASLWEIRRHLHPPVKTSSRLGRTVVGTKAPTSCRARHEDVIGTVGGPRKGKSVALGRRVRAHPGAAVVSSTRLDLRAMTLPWRAAQGPVWTFAPEGTGGVVSTLRWSPLVGCEDPRVAARRAGTLVEAVDSGSSDDQTWMQSGAAVLGGFLLAAATADLTMREVFEWTVTWRHPEPVMILAEAGFMVEAASLASEINSPAEKAAASVVRVVRQAVEFMRDDNVADVVCPRPGDVQLSVEELIDQRGTLYMVGTSRKFSPTAPLLAALWGWLFDEAVALANARGGKLDEAILFGMDEIAVTAKVALDDWTAYCGGHGIHVDWTAQNKAQLRERWGQNGADSIWDNTSALCVFGGIKNHEDLRAISDLCGERRQAIPGDDDGREEWRPVLPVSVLRRIPKFRCLLIHADVPPTILATSRWWRVPAAVRTTRSVLSPSTARSLVTRRVAEALEAPVRQAIPMPGPVQPHALPPVTVHAEREESAA